MEAARTAPSARRTRTGTRLRLYSRAVLFAVLVAFVISVAGGSGNEAAAGRLGGDFPAFYAAGTIVAEGDWATLYDPARQLEAQAGLFEDDDDGFLYFAYPPYVASLYRPLAGLDYRVAYTLHTVAMAAAVVGALAVLRPTISLLQRDFEVCVTATVLFYPLFRAATGGQNTALTVLLIAVCWRALHDDQDLAAGVAIGLLLYKPQFALPLMGLVLLGRRWQATASAVATGALLWAVGAAVMGGNWLAAWWSEASDFAALDADVNGHNAVSFLGFAEGLWGAGSAVALLTGGPLAVASGAALAWLWWRGIGTLDARMAATIAGVVLLSPHAMFYDAGLFALVGLVVVDRLGPRAHVPVAAVWALAWSQQLASAIGVAPLFFLVVGAGAWSARALLTPPPSPGHAPGSWGGLVSRRR